MVDVDLLGQLGAVIAGGAADRQFTRRHIGARIEPDRYMVESAGAVPVLVV